MHLPFPFQVEGIVAPLLSFRLGRFLFNKEFCPMFLHYLHTPSYKLGFLQWTFRTTNLIATSALGFGSRSSDKSFVPLLPFHYLPGSATIPAPVTNCATLFIYYGTRQFGWPVIIVIEETAMNILQGEVNIWSSIYCGTLGIFLQSQNYAWFLFT